MSLNVNFQGKVYTIKASKKFADLKKTLTRKIPELEKQEWEFYYYDDEGDNIEVGEEEEYQSLFDFAKSQKTSVKCEINYKNSSKVEQKNQQMNSDKQSEEAEGSQQQSGSDPEESQQGYEATEFQKSQPDNDQEEPPKKQSAINSTNDSKKTQVVETKKQDPQKQEPQDVSSDLSSEDEEQQDEDKEQHPPYVRQTESKLVDQVKPVSKVAEPKKEVQQNIIEQPAERQQPAVKVQQPKAQHQQSAVKEQRQPVIQAQQPEVKKPKQKRKNETVKAPRVIEELPNAENAPAQAESQVITVTIPKEEYERLLAIEQAYHNRQFQLADHEFASGIKSASSNMRCTFCCMDENLNVMPSFENLLICDNCNEKYEIKLKVKPFRSKMSRNSSALSGNRLF